MCEILKVDHAKIDHLWGILCEEPSKRIKDLEGRMKFFQIVFGPRNHLSCRVVEEKRILESQIS